MKANREVVVPAVQRNQRSSKALLLRMTLLFILWFWVSALSVACLGQDDFYPIPQRQGNFGFPYPAASVDEPGVTFARRYLLDGEPELGFSPRQQDEIWLVSSRDVNAERTHCGESCQTLICKHPVGTTWNQVPIRQLLDVQHRHSEIPTVIFIHGNRTPAFWSRRRGKQAYQALVGPRGDSHSELAMPTELPSTRFVIWSWPSDPVKGPFKDFGAKSERSRVDGHLFGEFLQQLGNGPIVIVAYSLGTQIALDGIESLADQSYANTSDRSIQLISMAPVTRCDWPDCHDQVARVASQVDQMNLFQNSKDIALKAFDVYCRVNGEKPCNAAIAQLAATHGRANQVDVSEAVGTEHNILSYVKVPSVRSKLAELIASQQ